MKWIIKNESDMPSGCLPRIVQMIDDYLDGLSSNHVSTTIITNVLANNTDYKVEITIKKNNIMIMITNR